MIAITVQVGVSLSTLLGCTKVWETIAPILSGKLPVPDLLFVCLH